MSTPEVSASLVHRYDNASSAKPQKNGYHHPHVDLKDAELVATALEKHATGLLPGASLADEIVQALLEENKRLRSEVTSLKEKGTPPPESAPQMGFALQVMTTEFKRSGQRLEIAQTAADSLEESSRGLQEEVDAMRAEFTRLYEAEERDHPNPVLEEDFTPPSREVELKPMPEKIAQDPHEVMTYKLWGMERKIERANERAAYYQDLPAKAEELREALTLARAGNWAELFGEETMAIESVPQEVTQGVVSDLVVENAQLKKEAGEHAARADSLQNQLDASRDEVAVQKLTILEMEAKIALLQRQLKGSERIIADQAVQSSGSWW